MMPDAPVLQSEKGMKLGQFDLQGRARPVLKWAGGKSALLPQLIENFPTTFDRFIEPFMGGGAVGFALREGRRAILNDTNPEIINLYRVIRDTPTDLMRGLDALSQKYSEEFYYLLRAQCPESDVAKAARTVFLNKTGFNGLYRQNSKGGFNVPYGKRTECPALYDRENLARVSVHLALADLRNEDFGSVLDSARKGDFVYCDPPYEPLSATSSFNSYTSGGFSRSEQTRLRDACAAAAARGAIVAVSNSSAPFIKELYADWDVRSVSARRAINSKGSARGEIKEVLVILDSAVARTARPARIDVTVSLDLQG